MTERATPRTDEKTFHRDSDEFGAVDYVVNADLSRQLERELAEAREETLEQARLLGMGGQREAKLLSELAEAKDEIARLNQSLKSASLIYDEAKEQRDRLAEALRDSMEFIPATLQGPMRKALDSLA